jgi:uncharacterized Zn-binding protein involved in type VI secretion
MRPVASVGDVGVIHPGMPVILTGNPTVLVNGRPVATVGSRCCPHLIGKKIHVCGVISGNPTVLIGGLPVARVGDVLGPLCTTITTGSFNVFA